MVHDAVFSSSICEFTSPVLEYRLRLLYQLYLVKLFIMYCRNTSFTCYIFIFLGCHEELRQIRDVSNRRLETLKTENKSCYEVVQWLRKHQDNFQYPIIEPMILVVSISSTMTVVYSWDHKGVVVAHETSPKTSLSFSR